MLDGKGGEIVEQTLQTRELGNQHHADQKQIDIDAFRDPGERIAPRQQTEQHQRGRAQHRPDRLGQAKGADDDARCRKHDDAPGPNGSIRRDRHVQSSIMR
jgi:hypothetical protein